MTGKTAQNTKVKSPRQKAAKRTTHPKTIRQKRKRAPMHRIRELIKKVESIPAISIPFGYCSPNFLHGAKKVLRRTGMEKKW